MNKVERREKHIDLQVSVEEHQEEIIEMIKDIKKIGTLEYLNTFIRMFLEKWG